MDWNSFRSSLKGSGLSQQDMSKKYKEIKSLIPEECSSKVDIENISEDTTLIKDQPNIDYETEKFILLSEFLDFVNFKFNRTENKISDKIKKDYYNKVKPNTIFKDAIKMLKIRIQPDKLSEVGIVVKYKAEWIEKQLRKMS